MKNKCVILVLFILIRIITSCNNINKIDIVRDNSIGLYYLDLSKSNIRLNCDDSLYFNNLTFKLTKDSFEFSRKLPYEYDSVGTWILEEIDVEIVYIRLVFNNGNEWQIGPGDNYINMPYWYTIEKYPNETGNLHFVKLNN